jgi:hypothetical protein
VWAHQQFSGRNTELLICVDELGSIEIDHTEGARGNASLTAGMLALLKGKQKCRLWHNHPSGGSLSVDDLRLMLSFPDIVEIAAVNANGSLFRGAVQDPSKLTQLAVQKAVPPKCDYDDLLQSAELVMTPVGAATNVQAFLVQLVWTVSHVVNLELSARNVVYYESNLSEHDSMLLQEGKNRGLVTAAENEVRNALDGLGI